MEQAALELPMTEGEPIELVFPFTPKSKNQWANMPQLHQRSYRKKWRGHLDKQLEKATLRADAVRVEVEIWFSTNRGRDWQNYAFPIHWDLADALVGAGVIPDDTPTHYRVGPNGGILFRVDRTKFATADEKQRTVIRVFPVE